MMSQGRAVLVVNSRARGGAALYGQAKDLLSAKGFELAAAYPVRDPARIPEIVQEAVARGERLIVIGGGDGTISSVVDYLAYRDVVLGIVPMGTANNFARAVGLPLNVSEAVGVIAEGHAARIDLGKINNNYFSNAVSLGISASIHRGSPDQIKRWLGRAGYFLVAARRFAVHRPFHCRLQHDGRVLEVEALDLRIANGPYHGGVVAVPTASVDSRQLAVRIIKGSSKWTLARVWANIYRGVAQDPASVEILHVGELAISTDPQQPVSVDGEVVAQTPVTISVAAEALWLMVPQNFASSPSPRQTGS
jgi:YegS/Rv2252/BmrU family lipid kinase